MVSIDYLYLISASVLLGASSFLTRNSFTLFQFEIKEGSLWYDLLRYAPACALTAVLAPLVLLNDQHQLISDWQHPKLWAALLAITVYQLTRHNLLALSSASALFVVWQIWLNYF